MLSPSESRAFLAAHGVRVGRSRVSRLMATLPHELRDGPTPYRVVSEATWRAWLAGYPHKRGPKPSDKTERIDSARV